MAFAKTKRTMGVKIETTPYTEETLANTDYNIRWVDNSIEYSPEIEMYARKIARGHMSYDPSIAGKRELKASGKFEVYAVEGELDRPPAFGKLFRISGCRETIHAGTGVSYVLHGDYTKVPATIEIQERDEGGSPSCLVIKGRGGMGNTKLVLDSVGQPMYGTIDIRSVLVGISDRDYGDIITPSIIDTDLPDAVLSATISLFDETQRISKTTIDFGNDLQLYPDPANTEGYEGAHIVNRNPTFELDPDLELIATHSDFSRWTGNTTGAAVITLGSNTRMDMPAVQIIKAYNPQEREGHVTSMKNCELKGVVGNDEFTWLQGATS